MPTAWRARIENLALEGTFDREGVTLTPAFQVLKDRVARYPLD